MNFNERRKLSKKLFDETNLKKTPIEWHVWKMAFDLGWNKALTLNDSGNRGNLNHI